MLNLRDSLKLLEKYEIPVVETYFIDSEDAAVEMAKKIGYPLVMKIISDEITHKTDIGGVLTGLDTKEKVSEAFWQLSKSKYFKEAALQRSCSGCEIFIGAKRDPVFGPAIMFGLGGVFVELLRDVSLRIIPAKRDDLHGMMKETKGYKLLAGYRGRKGVNIDAIIDVLESVSRLMMKEECVLELDLNPLFASEEGVVCVDARVGVSE